MDVVINDVVDPGWGKAQREAHGPAAAVVAVGEQAEAGGLRGAGHTGDGPAVEVEDEVVEGGAVGPQATEHGWDLSVAAEEFTAIGLHQVGGAKDVVRAGDAEGAAEVGAMPRAVGMPAIEHEATGTEDAAELSEGVGGIDDVLEDG